MEVIDTYFSECFVNKHTDVVGVLPFVLSPKMCLPETLNPGPLASRSQ